MNSKQARELSIVEVAERLGFSLTGENGIVGVMSVDDDRLGGGDYSSLKFDTDNQTWRRWSGISRGGFSSGGVIDLCCHVLDTDDISAILNWLDENADKSKKFTAKKKVKRKVNPEIDNILNRWYKAYPSSPAESYVGQRHIDKHVANRNFLGYCNQLTEDVKSDMVSLPWIDWQGKVWGIRKRLINPPEGFDKLSSLSGSMFQEVIYGEHLVTPYFDPGFVIVTEGDFNCLAAQSLGYHAVSIGGQGSVKNLPRLISYLSNYKRILIWKDEHHLALQLAQYIYSNIPGIDIQLVSSKQLAGSADINDMLISDPYELREKILDAYVKFSPVPESKPNDYNIMPYDVFKSFGISPEGDLDVGISICKNYGNVGIIKNKERTDVYSLNNLRCVYTGDDNTLFSTIFNYEQDSYLIDEFITYDAWGNEKIDNRYRWNALNQKAVRYMLRNG